MISETDGNQIRKFDLYLAAPKRIQRYKTGLSVCVCNAKVHLICFEFRRQVKWLLLDCFREMDVMGCDFFYVSEAVK